MNLILCCFGKAKHNWKQFCLRSGGRADAFRSVSKFTSAHRETTPCMIIPYASSMRLGWHYSKNSWVSPWWYIEIDLLKSRELVWTNSLEFGQTHTRKR